MSIPNKTVFAADTATYSATMEVEVIGGVVTCPDTDVAAGQKKVKLSWEMVTEGWEIIGVHGLPYPEFTKKAKEGYDFKCKDKNKNKQDYKYTIIVGSTSTAEVLLLDPTIRNGGIGTA
jgi:hypothetical protein